MFFECQPKRYSKLMSIIQQKMPGYSNACHIVVLPRIAFLPKAKNKTSGDALMNELTTPDARPGGAIAGARAIKTSTFSFRLGWIDSVAKA